MASVPVAKFTNTIRMGLGCYRISKLPVVIRECEKYERFRRTRDSYLSRTPLLSDCRDTRVYAPYRTCYCIAGGDNVVVGGSSCVDIPGFSPHLTQLPFAYTWHLITENQ